MEIMDRWVSTCYLSRFIRVRDGDSVRCVWDVVERLVLVNVLQDQTQVTNDVNKYVL